MKIIQVNAVCGTKSTGRICVELSEFLRKKGHKSYVAYSHETTQYKYSMKFGKRVEKKIHALLSRITGLQGYFSYFGTRDLIRFMEKIKPDIVHLHNLHTNNINIVALLKYLKNKNIGVVITLHDCWFFTGKCMYFTVDNCYQWRNGCKNKCPRLKKDNLSYLFDKTEKMYNDKKKYVLQINKLAIIGVSNWITEEAKKSFLSNAFIIKSIYNWIDQNDFKPSTNDQIYRKYHISKKKFTIIGVAAEWRKGNKLEDFVHLSNIIPFDMQIILVGKVNEVSIIPENIIHIPFTDNVKELAELYSISDVYVHVSLEDTFGKVIAEALACGTPAIVYNSTACPEVLGENEKCGYIVPQRDVEEIFNCILKIKENKKAFYSEQCIRHVHEHFDYEQNAKEILKIYKQLYDKKSN